MRSTWDPVEQMRRLSALTGGDVESNHSEAEEILLRVLEDKGEFELVRQFKRVKKWYA